MEKLSEALKREIPDVDLELAKKIISVFKSWQTKFNEKHCNICYEEITRDNYVPSEPMDYNIVCKKHIDCRHHINPNRSRRDLNIEVIEPFDL